MYRHTLNLHCVHYTILYVTSQTESYRKNFIYKNEQDCEKMRNNCRHLVPFMTNSLRHTLKH